MSGGNKTEKEKPVKEIEKLKTQINEKIAKEGLKKDIKIDLSNIINPTIGIQQKGNFLFLKLKHKF
jgi:hypothetical protein